MSDTDDTDVLVNIPPHSFLQGASETESLESLYQKRKKPKEKHFQIITQQVDKLKLSLDKLENISCSDPSSRDFFGQRKCTFFSKDPSINPYDIYSSSDCSAVSYLSITSTINMETKEEDSSNTKQREDKFILNEIDNFLKKIENNTSTSYLEQCSYLDTPSFHKSHKDHSLTKNSNQSPEEFVFTPEFISKHSQQMLDDDHFHKTDRNILSKSEIIGDGYLKGSVPDYGFGMKELMYSNETDLTKKPSKHESINKTSSTSKIPYYSTLRDQEDETKSSKTSYKNEALPSRSYSRRKFTVNRNNDPKIVTSEEQSKITDGLLSTQVNEPITKATKSNIYQSSVPNKQVNDSNSMINLLNECKSVSTMPIKKQQFDELRHRIENYQQSAPNIICHWNSSGDETKEIIPDLKKYEEEKIRREHCEQSIQQLQKALLEQQQQLAIAKQTELSKDETIMKLKESFTLLMNKTALREDEFVQEAIKTSLELKMLLAENNQLNETLRKYKEETMKIKQATDSCEEKYKILLNEKCETIQKLQTEANDHHSIVKKKDDLYNELKESNLLVVLLNKQTSETISNMRTGMDKMTDENQKLLENVVDSKKSIEQLQDQITLLKNEKDELISKISEERAQVAHINTQKTKLQARLDETTLKFKELENLCEMIKQESTIQKDELKSHYQQQVETIVFEKVNEFQKQLNTAETTMAKEMKSKEKEVTMQLVKQLQKMEEQHKTEISILEEKHKEEINLYRLQLAQSSKKITHLESSLNSYKNRRGQIVAQLHSVMENQWKEALKIITNNPHGDNSSNSQTDPALYKLGISSSEQKNSKKNKDLVDNKGDYEESSMTLNLNKVMLSKNDDQKSSPLTEEEIHNYIKMLLQKAPGIRDILDTNDDVKHKLDDDDNYAASERSGRRSSKRSSCKKPWK